jgi:hypothetical protein
MGVAFSFRLLITPCGLVCPAMSRYLAATKCLTIASNHTYPYSDVFVFMPSHPKDRDGDCLRGGWSGDRIPVGTIFSVPVQTGIVAQPASYTLGSGSFTGVKLPRRGVAHPLLIRAKVEERACYRFKFTSTEGLVHTFRFSTGRQVSIFAGHSSGTQEI